MRSIDWFQGPCPQRIPDMRLEPVDLAKKSRVTGNMVIHTYSMYVWDDVSYSMLFLYYMMLVSWKGTKKTTVHHCLNDLKECLGTKYLQFSAPFSTNPTSKATESTVPCINSGMMPSS